MNTKTNQTNRSSYAILKRIYVSVVLIFVFTTYSCKKEQYSALEKAQFLQGSGYGISSAMFSVQDIDSTKNYFSEKLGFKFNNPKGFDEGMFEGTLRSMIAFPDMSSLQILSVQDTIDVSSKDSLMRSFLNQEEGARMYAISSSSISDTKNWLTSQGFKMDSIHSYVREYKNSEKEDWGQNSSEITSVGYERVRELSYFPVFIQLMNFPYNRMHQWNSFYNMQRSFLKHPNGAVGIKAIRFVVSDLEEARKQFLKMGFTEMEANASAGNRVRFKIKRNQELEIIEPQSADDEFSNFLEERKSKMFSILFEVKNMEETLAFFKENLPEKALRTDSVTNRITILKDYAKGVNLEFIQEPEEQTLTAEKLNLNYGSKLDSVARTNADTLYQKYCSLCHGINREGNAADHAPSLRSKSLLATSKTTNFMRYTIQYGRGESAMAGYYDELGGPLTFLEIELILKWLQEEAGVEEPIVLSREPVSGDIELGKEVYQSICAECHGKEGEGISAPALGNPMLLATATDDFLRYAIKEGRDSTEMIAYKNVLKENEIDAVTAFLRSRASGWNVPKLDSIKEPKPEDYIINPKGKAPNFELKEGGYVSAKQLNDALQDSARIVILDARSKVAWRQTHIPGAIPVPYYEDPEEFVKHIPKDDNTWIVAYCACPHAASGKVIKKLNKLGYKNTAILDEGILVWAQLGYPVSHGN